MGNVELLELFHERKFLFGDVKSQPIQRHSTTYLEVAAQDVVRKISGKPFATEIIESDVVNSIAVAKSKRVDVQLNYHDFLSSIKLTTNG